jgi:CelD/BcsL family acetyltransferase involved in cellulose biosynthesis
MNATAIAALPGAIVDPVGARGSSLAICIVRTRAELHNLESAWNDLFDRARCDNVFLTYEWLAAWADAFCPGSSLFIVAISTETNGLIALAPLYISQSFLGGPRRLGLLGDRFVGSDYLDFLVDRECADAAMKCIREIIQSRHNEWDYIEFADVDSETLVTAFQSSMQAAGYVTQTLTGARCPFIALPPSAGAFLAGLPNKLRSNLKYYKRALQREGTLKLIDVTNNIDPAFAELVRLHERRFTSQNETSAFLAPEVRALHKSLAAKLAERRLAHIFLLELNGKAIAALYGFSIRGRMLFYQSGFDPEYSRFGVGTLLLGEVITACIESGHREFDFLRGDEAYKYRWATGTRTLYTERIFSRSPGGLAARVFFAALEWLRRAKRATTAHLHHQVTSSAQSR